MGMMPSATTFAEIKLSSAGRLVLGTGALVLGTGWLRGVEGALPTMSRRRGAAPHAR
jgi:hypothetical protein